MSVQSSEQPGPGCIHVGIIESLAPAEPDKHRCRKCYGAVWPEAAAPDPVAPGEPSKPADKVGLVSRTEVVPSLAKPLVRSNPDSGGDVGSVAAAPDPAALADRLVEEGRVSVWGRPGTKFTAKRAKAPEATDG